jgi:hypothetical protein
MLNLKYARWAMRQKIKKIGATKLADLSGLDRSTLYRYSMSRNSRCNEQFEHDLAQFFGGGFAETFAEPEPEIEIDTRPHYPSPHTQPNGWWTHW